MANKTIEEQVIRILAKELRIRRKRRAGIMRDTQIVHDLGAGEIDYIGIKGRLEGKFGLRISDEDMDKMTDAGTVGYVIDYVKANYKQLA